MSFINGNRPTSFVFPDNEIRLIANFMEQGKVQIVHELTHVIDNKMSGKMATIFGGGPADELVKFLGGNPHGLRFLNGNFEIPSQYLWTRESRHLYGNNSYADYFAECMAVAIYAPSVLPDPIVKIWLETLINLSK